MKIKILMLLFCISIQTVHALTPVAILNKSDTQDIGGSGPIKNPDKSIQLSFDQNRGTCVEKNDDFPGKAVASALNWAGSFLNKIEPCSNQRSKGVAVFCNCVSAEQAKKNPMYSIELSALDKQEIKEKILENQLSVKMKREVESLEKYIQNQVFLQSSTPSCTLSKVKEMSCSPQGMKVLAKAFGAKDTKQDFKTFIETKLKNWLLPQIRATSEGRNFAESELEEIIGSDSFELRLNNVSMPALLAKYYENIKSDKIEKADQTNLIAQLKNKLQDDKNSVWRKFFKIESVYPGEEEILIRNDEELKDENSVISFLSIKIKGSNDSDAIVTAIEKNPNEFFSNIQEDISYNVVDEEQCLKTIHKIEKLCSDKSEYILGDVLGTCDNVNNLGQATDILQLHKEDLAICSSMSITNFMTKDNFYRFDLTHNNEFSPSENPFYCADKELKRPNASVMVKEEMLENTTGSAYSQDVAANINKPKMTIPSSVISSIIGSSSNATSKSRSDKSSSALVPIIPGSSNLDSFMPGNINTSKAVEAENVNASDWAKNFVNQTDTKLPGQSEWENFKAQTNVPPAVEQKYEQLKDEDKEITDKEKKLAEIASKLKEKETQLDAATKAFNDKQVSQVREELKKLEAELKSSKDEISKLRERQKDSVDSFKAQVAAIGPEKAEPSRSAVASTSFSSGNGINNSRSSSGGSDRADDSSFGPASTPSNNKVGGNNANRSVNTLGTGGGSSREVGNQRESAGVVVKNIAPITLINELALTASKVGETIEISGQKYEVVTLSSGEFALRSGDSFFVPDKTNPKKLLPVDKTGKLVDLKSVAVTQKSTLQAMPSRKPAGKLDETAKRIRYKKLKEGLE